MDTHGINPIDMVVVNLYPFAETVAKDDCTLEDAVENIDIGGPTMVRSAAKNHKDVTIVVNASDYNRVLEEMGANNGSLTLKTRFDLAISAFEHTAAYDGMIANYFGTMVPSYGDNKEGDDASKFPRTFNQQFIKKQDMRYGENSHQAAAFYTEATPQEASVSTATQLQGSVMASDAFFPFRDGIDAAAEAGITCVIQPGGSMRDDEVITAADEHGMAMVFTGMRHFRH
eukprot:snap_masked-scaffold166_size294552-processed-gene-1.39 protein:Tk03407 transcript:snap_masked-scaffold166_size294552-processed-gene-1.39-mRNA-1 annotation:"imp cyclohydrolase"